MTDHARIRELLAAPPTFALSAAEQAEVDAHLRDCDPCRTFADGVARDALRIAALPRVDAPDSVRAAVLGGARRRRPLGWYPAAAAAALVLIVAPFALAATLLGVLRIPGLNFCIGCSGGAASTPAPTAAGGEETPHVEPTGAPPMGPPSEWSVLDLANPGAVLPTAFDALATNDRLGATVAVGAACRPESGTCAAVVARSSDGVTWRLLDTTPDTDIERLADGAAAGMRDVVAGGPGFVAVGAAGRSGTPSATVWTSDDGTTWRRMPDADALHDSWMNAIAVLDDGTLVAVGGRLVGGSVHAAAWTSPDARSWVRSSDTPDLDVGSGSILLGREAPGIHDLIAAPEIGLVAIGLSCDAPAGPCRGAAWTSVDGASWQVTSARDAFDAGQPLAAAWRDGLVTAVGSRADLPAIWVSKDGQRWLPVELESPLPGGRLLSVGDVSGITWAAGSGELGQAGIWSSDDGPWRLTASRDLDAATIRALLDTGVAVVIAGEQGGRGQIWVGGTGTSGP